MPIFAAGKASPRTSADGRIYTGRFAPSPTGPLHFGSLVAAVASFLDARAHGGRWLVRMEDIDTPRCVPGADADILRTLEGFGFEWDGPVMYQSARLGAYREALDKLRRDGMAYPCSCSRKDLGSVYPGTCRSKPRTTGVCEPGKPVAWRVRVDPVELSFEDRALGFYRQNLAEEVGDFVVLRSDGLFAYQLAVVVDDAVQDVTDVVRGADLLDSTPRQIWLERLLGIPQSRYLHVPVAANAAGEKLSKQTLAPALRIAEAAAKLRAALRFLGEDVPDETGLSAGEILTWATERWSAESSQAGTGRGSNISSSLAAS
jgi:glutamyl-Q tRNA(Asp) synthetase